jgi:uncharacterized protein with NRDE domain
VCTLTLWWRVFPDFPVVVAANRDEDPARPWDDARLWPDEPAGLFAGRDLRAGGTWLGVNRHGVVCGITNRWGPAEGRGRRRRGKWGAANDPARPSRGLVVRDALRAPSAEAAVAALARRDTNPFGLLVADGDHAFRVDASGASVASRALAPGITVLANWSSDERMPRSDRALALASAVPTGALDAALPAIARLVADHDGAELPGQAICGHGERYATVSSTIVAVGAGEARWRDVRGNPCTGTWVERTDVLSRGG